MREAIETVRLILSQYDDGLTEDYEALAKVIDHVTREEVLSIVAKHMAEQSERLIRQGLAALESLGR